MMRGHAVFAVENLVTRGNDVKEASRKVVQVWNRCTGEERHPDTVKSWYDRRDKIREGDPAIDVLANCRAIWDPDNLDLPSAEFVRKALRVNGLDEDLKSYLPQTEIGVLKLLELFLFLTKSRFISIESKT